MRYVSSLLVFGLCFSAACGASINPSYRADVDQRISALQPSTSSYAASGSFEPPALAVGQWIQLKIVDDKQLPGLITYKVVGQEGDAFWFETENDNYKSKQEIRMLIRMGDRTNPETFEVKALSMRTNGKVSEYPPGLLGMLKSLWKPLVNVLQVQWKDLPQEDVHVLAGEFSQAFKRRSTASFASYTVTSDTWCHPAVPINGLVRSVGVDKPTTMELVAFGTEGAQSSF